ncbi:hypothetical protein EVC37_15545 [Methylocaldum sp. BRCS4]|jgi:hypothetical protein|nr:hypothetical protein [Methylocaldum sp. BRCS4]
MILRTEFLPDEKIVIGTATRNLKNHIIADRFIAKPAKKSAIHDGMKISYQFSQKASNRERST